MSLRCFSPSNVFSNGFPALNSGAAAGALLIGGDRGLDPIAALFHVSEGREHLLQQPDFYEAEAAKAEELEDASYASAAYCELLVEAVIKWKLVPHRDSDGMMVFSRRTIVDSARP